MLFKNILLVGFLIVSVLHAYDSVYVNFYGKLVRVPDDNSELVTVFGDKSKLTIISEQGNWLEVQARGFRGWINKSQTTFIENEVSQNKNLVIAEESDDDSSVKEIGFKSIASNSFLLVFALTFAFILLIFSVIVILKVRKRRRSKFRSDVTMETEAIDHQQGARYHVLIFSEKDKNVKSSVSNIHKRLSTCFREIGFSVSFTGAIRNNRLDVPFKIDLMAIDYSLEKSSIKSIEKLIEKRILPENIPVLFYNIKNPEEVDPSMILKRSFYLGKSINEQDLLKIASLIITKKESVGQVLLQGKITGDGIYEILQLVEIGRKTGLLKIKDYNGKSIGVIGFTGGIIHFARTSTKSGRDASLEMLEYRQGEFQFQMGVLGEKNCQIVPQELMMSAAKIEDENINYHVQNSKGGPYERIN